jgi:RNA polymerase sigma factor (TIGR02999 family)
MQWVVRRLPLERIDVGQQTDITQMLGRLEGGDPALIEELFGLLYDPLKIMALKQLQSERRDHTLNATALVHEAYLKLVDQRSVTWQNRAHFFAVAAQAMRRILIDYARGRLAAKRGGGQALVTFNEEAIARSVRADELVALDLALVKLAELDARQAKVVEFKFFGGLTHEEIAQVLGVSVQTVQRDWRFARAWLGSELGASPSAPGN